MEKEYEVLRAKTLNLLGSYPPISDNDFAFPVKSLKNGKEGFIFKTEGKDLFTIVEQEETDGEFLRVKSIKNRTPIFSGSLKSVVESEWITL